MGRGGGALRHHLRKRRVRGDGCDVGDPVKRGPPGAVAHAKSPREAGVVTAIAGLSLAFIMALGTGVSGTLAYITDTQTSTGNLLAAGTLNLTTDDVNGVTRTLYAPFMSPGDTAGPGVITLKNTGTVDGDTLDIVFSYTESDDGPNTDPDADAVAALLEVVTLNYGGASLLGSISDTNSNGYKDVKELTLPTNFTGLSGLAASASKEFEIAVRLRSETPNDFQGHGIDVTMTFTLKQ